MSVKLSTAQKEEIRRLTQLANRRIKAAEKHYSAVGKEILPVALVGPEYQLKDNWATPNTPISRSIKFDTMSDYRKQLAMLRRFERERPNVTTYTRVNREKTLAAIETATGLDVPKALQDKVNKMNIHDLLSFWQTFEEKATKVGMKYSSDSVMISSLSDYYEEDFEYLYDEER